MHKIKPQEDDEFFITSTTFLLPPIQHYLNPPNRQDYIRDFPLIYPPISLPSSKDLIMHPNPPTAKNYDHDKYLYHRWSRNTKTTSTKKNKKRKINNDRNDMRIMLPPQSKNNNNSNAQTPQYPTEYDTTKYHRLLYKRTHRMRNKRKKRIITTSENENTKKKNDKRTSNSDQQNTTSGSPTTVISTINSLVSPAYKKTPNLFGDSPT